VLNISVRWLWQSNRQEVLRFFHTWLNKKNMVQEEERAVAEEKADIQENNTSLSFLRGNNIVIIICVALSMLFMRTGILSFLFLVPLGFAVLVTGSLWFTFLAAMAANIAVYALTSIFGNNNSSFWIDIIYFSIIFMMFIWIIGGKFLRTTYRMVLGSLVGAFAFLIIIISNDSLNVFLHEMAEIFASLFISPAENEEIALVTAERVVELIKMISWRGGALVSMVLMFFINRQITFVALRLFRKQSFIKKTDLINFYTPVNVIWIKVGALVAVLLSNLLNIEILEILAWNVLTVCIILFLAQGIGIVLFLLAKRSAVFRLISGVAIILVIISPINTIALIALLLLGVVEIWLPIRTIQRKS
jgi:hypothetical protein